jgi:hypothetical protein
MSEYEATAYLSLEKLKVNHNFSKYFYILLDKHLICENKLE